MRRMGWLGVYVLVCASLFGSGAAWGQTNGEIRGTVNDPSGAIVPGATITATLTGTDSARTVTSDGDGAFTIPELAVGSYDVTTNAQGFKKSVTKNVVVTIGHVNFITVTLQLGGSADTVTVEANAVEVETTSTQLGAVMTDTAIVQLPMNTRNAYSLLQLQPGVQSQLGNDLFFGSDNAGAVSVNGGRGRANNYMVNGGDGNDIFVNAPAIQPSPDAIEEFRVLTNTFDAEYGRNSGSIVNVVTKSGTNAVHGDFYEFLRNQALNDRGYFDPFLLDYKQNQFGATIGGPIKKDKTFIFGSYEGNRLVQGISSGTVLLPSPAEVGGDFSNNPSPTNPLVPFVGATDAPFASVLNNGRAGCSAAIAKEGGTVPTAGALYSNIFPGNKIPTQCFDPTALGVFQHYVAPFQSAANPTTNQLISSGNRDMRGDQFTVRLDHSITPAQKFTAYYYFEDDDRTDPFSNFQAAGATLPGFAALFKTRTQQWNLSHTWTIGSTMVNEFRFNYFRESQQSQNHPVNTFNSVQDSCVVIPAANCFTNQADPTAGITTNLPGRVGLPFISVSGGFAIGNNFEGELPQTGNTFQWTDNFTKIVGKHTIKFGGDVRRQRFDQFLFFEVSGNYSFVNQPNGDQIQGPDAYPNYFLGAADSYQQGSAQGENVRNTALYLFAQDSYKLSNSVTLNYGLRWELNTPYYDRGNRLQTFRPGQATTQYPCFISTANAQALQLPGDGNCGQGTPNDAVFPLGLVFPGDKGVPRGLTSTDYKSFAPRIGIAWSPGATDGWIAKLTGGPGKLSVRAGFGLFYNPIEQLVLEQFSAEPPFGGSTFLSQTLFNTPFTFQGGGDAPNPFMGVINQTPQTPCAVAASTTGPNGCVDWSTFRPLLLFGEFQPHLKSQYSEQYNLTIERQLTKDMLFRISYVGTQAHHLLASHDLNAGNAQTCAEIGQIAANDPTGQVTGCGPVGADGAYFIPPTYSNGAPVVIPTFAPPTQPFKVPAPTCTGLALPYNAGSGGNCIQGGTVLSTVAPNGITLVGTRPFSSPNCQPFTGIGCPADGVPVFSNIFAEDTIANSNYNALQVSVEKSYVHGLLFQASYTFSKAIDQGASFEQQLNPLNFNATRGLSLLSAKNRFVFSPVWELPIPKRDGVAGKFANGWQLSAIISYQSGFPIRIEDQNDGELQSSFFFEDANTPTATAKVQFLNPQKNGNVFFNPNNFTDPTSPINPTPLGQFGNTPHSLCCGPALSNTDFVVTKKTPINERWSTEFRAEFYNLFNHTQFSNPDGNFTDGIPPNGTFGQILNTREGPRVLQFGLKFLF